MAHEHIGIERSGEPAPDSGEIVGCPDCGLIQTIPGGSRRGSWTCRRCGRPLERRNGRSIDAALACSLGTLLLLFPANLMPMLQVDILGRVNQTHIASGVLGFWNQDWPLVAVVVGLEIVAIPFLRFGLLTAVLAALRLGRKDPWIGPAFRWAEHLDQWGMPDVFIVGCAIGYARVAPYLPIRIDAGGYCLLAAALLALVTRATLERRLMWRRVGPVARELHPGMIGCTVCDYPSPADAEGGRCPRCGARITRCSRFGTMRAMALTLAAFAFYPAAYLFPMENTVQLNRVEGYSIMTGVEKLVEAHLWFFAAIVFFASVMVPLLKLFAFAWFGLSIHRRSASRLRAKTKLYRMVDAVGRWSHIDVFTIAVFLPLMEFRGLLSTEVGWSLPAFLAVVVLTMFASIVFDPRRLWIAGGVA